MTERCGEMTNRGTPCAMSPVLGGPRCWNHSEAPEVVERRKAARTLGGIHRRRRKAEKSLKLEGEQISLRDPESILKMLEAAAADTLKLENSAQRSRTISTIATTALRALELTQLESRLERIEALLEQSHGNTADTVVVC